MERIKYIIATMFACILFFEGTLSANAQLEVLSDGTIYMKGDSVYGRTCVNIGNKLSNMTSLDYAYYYTGLRSFAYNPAHTGHTIGLFGEAKMFNPSTQYSDIGVWGVGGGAYEGRNIGVAATLHSNIGGAGLYATNQDNAFFSLSGNFSGYFYGPVHIEGIVYSTVGFYNVSDMRLKHDIIALADKEREKGSTLNNLMGLEVLEYGVCTPRQKAIATMPDSMHPTGKDPNIDIRHYGVSAQELQKLYPDLVMEGEDGYLSVNYSGLVPLLLRSIQELKHALDDIKENSDARKESNMTAVNTAMASGNVLYQNTPNPFKEQTTIRFSLADDTQSASICIFDMTGKMLKNLPVSTGDTSVSLNGWELGEGMFLYTLIVNGKEIDTRRMIITK